MIRPFLVLTLGGFLASASGCAGHKELKAPCANDKSTSLFSTVAYAASPVAASDCGPLIRQNGVSVF